MTRDKDDKELEKNQQFIDALAKKILGNKLSIQEEILLMANEKEIQNIAQTADALFGEYIKGILGVDKNYEPIIVKLNEKGKIELTEKELKEMLKQAYSNGYACGSNKTIFWPTTNTDGLTGTDFTRPI